MIETAVIVILILIMIICLILHRMLYTIYTIYKELTSIKLDLMCKHIIINQEKCRIH